MVGLYSKYPLLEAVIRRSRLSRSWTIVAVTGVLILLLGLLAFLDGVLVSPIEWSGVVIFLFNILFIAYIPTVYPFMLRSRKQAILAFRPLLSLEDDAFNKVAENISKPNRRWEWTAIFLGISIFMSVLFQPWNLDWASGPFWLTVYFVIIATIVYGLMGWLIYDTLVGIVRISRLSRQDLKLDILDTETMAPVASWSLSISLVFVGIILLSIFGNVIQADKFTFDAKTIIGYVIIICITLLIFFLSMWSAHRALSEAKKSKLTLARKHLMEISHRLENRTAKMELDGMENLSSTITSWATYQRLVKEAPTWPFNAGIIRRLLVSVLTPGLVYLIKILSQVGIRFGS
ncbi:hypothetical protein ACFLUJ_03260 [Chloroflexota bacterium]